MHKITLDLNHASTSIDSLPIEIDKNGVLARPVVNLCSLPINVTHLHIRYHLLRKVNVCGKSADGVIEVEAERKLSVTFLFDLIEFFESSILESKVIKACEKSWHVKFVSNHPSTAFLDSYEGGSVIFFYDAKQGDLSLEIKSERGSKKI